MSKIIHRCFLLCVAPNEGWWNALDAFAFCFFFHQRVDECGKFCFSTWHALSGFSRLSHWKCVVEHNRIKREKKKVSQAVLDRRFFSDFDFYCYSFVVWRQEKDLNQTVRYCFACCCFSCALNELNEKFSIIFFSCCLPAHIHTTIKTLTRFQWKTRFMTLSLNAMPARDTKIRISSYFAYDEEQSEW